MFVLILIVTSSTVFRLLIFQYVFIYVFVHMFADKTPREDPHYSIPISEALEQKSILYFLDFEQNSDFVNFDC